MSSGSLLEILQELKAVEWPTKIGGFKYAVGVLSLSLAAIIVLDKTGIPLSVEVKVAALIALQLFHFIVWLIKRYYFNDPNILTIAFGITTDEASRGLYKEIKKRFRQQISEHGLRKDIKIKELPTDIVFSDSDYAEKFIQDKGIRLLVWGNTDEGRVGNVPYSKFNIKLSYQYRVLNAEKQLKGDISMAIQRKIWGISHAESFQDLIVVSGNVLETSLFTIGACLATVPNVSYFEKSVDIFEKLREILKNRKQDINFPNLQLVQQKIRSILCGLYIAFMVYYWRDREDLVKAIQCAERVLKIDPDNFIAHQNMAAFQWRKGDKNRAHAHTSKAWSIKPGDPRPRLNRAFFFISDRNFEKAIKEYKKLESVDDTNVVEVVEFLEREFEKAKDNLGFIFAAGWLNLKFADRIRRRELLEEFVKKSDSNSTYSVLIEEAKRVLSTSS